MGVADQRTYPSDLTDAQWALVADLFEQRTPMGRPHVHPRRLIVNAILYQARTGCKSEPVNS
jgi:putative transposase